MIVNIRGTSGSGKTYAVRQLLHTIGDYQVSLDGRVVAHCGFLGGLQPVYVLGNYGGAECGGCDTIKTQDMVYSLVRHFGLLGHVVFEGVVVGTVYSRYAALNWEMEEYGIPYIWAYLDTPLDVCLTRVRDRRNKRGDNRPFDPATTESKFHATKATFDKAEADGFDVRLLNHKVDVVTQLLAILQEDKSFDFKQSYREESFR